MFGNLSEMKVFWKKNYQNCLRKNAEKVKKKKKEKKIICEVMNVLNN